MLTAGDEQIRADSGGFVYLLDSRPMLSSMDNYRSLGSLRQLSLDTHCMLCIEVHMLLVASATIWIRIVIYTFMGNALVSAICS